MRIALVVAGGVDRSGRDRVTPALLWLIARLARRHDVHVFVLDYYPEACSYELLGARIHDIGRVEGTRGFRRLRQRRRLATALAAHGRVDVLHAYQGLPAAATAPVAAALGTPLVVTLDSGELTAIDDISYGLQRRWIDRRAVASAVRHAARVTVGTQFMARLLAGRLGGAPPAIVPIGVDAGAFSPARPAEGPPWRLLRVGSINPVKDYPLLLRVMARLVGRGLDVHLDVAGEDTMAGRIQALTHALQLDARLAFHGVQPTDRIAPLYARAHLHLVTSRHEAAAIAVLEAAAAGVPTVGTRVGYVADWDPDRAVAVAVRDEEAFATAVSDLLGDPQRRTRLSAAAREWTLAHDADWTAEQFDRIYAEVAVQG